MTTSSFDMRLFSSIGLIINQALLQTQRRARWVSGVCLLALTGCSLVVSGYNQLPNLYLFLWVNPHLDLNSAQEKQAKSDLNTLLEWHRSEQLPLYADWLVTMQRLAPRDITADEVCTLAASIRESLDPLAAQFEEPYARLSLTLTTGQLNTLKKKYEEDLKDYRKEWKLDESDEAQLKVQVEKGQANAERFYGRLTPTQKNLLRELAKRSGYDGERTYAERARLQKENLAMHTRILQTRPSLDESRQLIRQWLQSSLHTTDPDYAIYLSKRIRHNCEAAAQLHNTLTQEQRARAVKVLKDYENDVRTLMRQRPNQG